MGMRRVRPVLFAAACLFAAGAAGSAVAADTYAPGYKPKDAAAAEHLRLERAAVELINRADARVRTRRSSCRAKAPDAEVRTTQDAPSQAVLDLLAPLRRPATAEDLPTGGSALRGFGETYVNYVRQATAANGQRFEIIVARTPTPFVRLPDSCLESSETELRHLLTGKPRAIRSVALGVFADLKAQQKRANAQPPVQDGIFLFTRNRGGGGGGGGGGNAAQFAKQGNFTSSGSRGRSTLSGLVPDGVASITLQYPKRVDRGRYFAPTIYPSAFERTVRVQQNVVSLRVPRGAGDAFPERMVWRDAAGKALRVVRRSTS